MKTAKYAWVTDEMFDNKLEEIVDKVVDESGPGAIMSIPGIYEILSEHFNNDVLEALENERDE